MVVASNQRKVVNRGENPQPLAPFFNLDIASWMSGLNPFTANEESLVTLRAVGSNPTLAAKFSSWVKETSCGHQC